MSMFASRTTRTVLAFLVWASLSALLNLGNQVKGSAVEKRSFAIYGARYWVNHGKFEGVLSSIQDSAVTVAVDDVANLLLPPLSS